LAVALASAASVTVHGDRELVGNVTPVQFDEGKKPVYFVLWWPPDDAKYVNLTAYLPYSADYRGRDVSVALFSDGLAVRLVGEADTHQSLPGLPYGDVAAPIVRPGARCAYAADPTFVRSVADVYGRNEAGWLGYLAWCLAGNVTLRAHRVNLTLPLWAFMGGSSWTFYPYRISKDLRGGDRGYVEKLVPVQLPEEGYVVWWPVVLPMVIKPEYKTGWYKQLWEANQLWKYEDVQRWRASVNSTLKLWPNSYLIVGIWPNGTVRQWRFVARPILLVERAERPTDITGMLAELCKYDLGLGCKGTGEYGAIPTLWADESVPNYNNIVGDKNNGTTVAWIRTAYPGVLQVSLYPNGTVVYIATKGSGNYTSPRVYLVYSLRRLIENRYGIRLFDFALLLYEQGYLPEGNYESLDMINFNVTVKNGVPLTVVEIYAPRVFLNGTVVVKRYTITNETGCIGFQVNKQGNMMRFKYTHKVAGCRLDQFLVEEFRLDVTPLRIPYVCPNCTGPIGFRLYEVKNPKGGYEWFFSAPAPTVLTPLLSYRCDEVASVKYYKLEGGRLVEVGWIGEPRYAVITFAKASKEYYALRAAAQVVGLLIP